MLCLCTQYIIYIAGKVRHLYVHMFKLCGRNVNFVNYDASVILESLIAVLCAKSVFKKFMDNFF